MESGEEQELLEGAGGAAPDPAPDARVRALEQRVRELAAIVDNSPDVFVRYDRDLRIRFVSAAMGRATGRPSPAWIGRRLEELELPPDVVATWNRLLARVLQTGEVEEVDSVLPLPDGPRSYHIRLVPVRDEAGQTVGVLTTSRDVTARVQAEAAARRADALVQGVFEHAAVGMALLSSEGHFLRVNPTLARLLGYTPGEMRGLRLEALLPADTPDGLRTRAAPLLAGEVAFYVTEQPYRRRDGTPIWLRASVSLLREEGGPPVLVGVLEDLSERRAVQERLLQRERLMQDGERLAGFGSWRRDLTSHVAVYSDQLLRIFGFDPGRAAITFEEFIGRVHPEDRERLGRLLDEVIARHGSYAERFRIILPDGRVRVLLERASVEEDAHGRAVRLVGVTQDVTEREAAEAALRASEERFRALVENASDLIVIMDERGMLRYASPSHERVLGVKPAAGLGRNPLEWAHPEDAQALHARFLEAMQRPGPTPMQLVRMRHADGSWRTFQVILEDMRALPEVRGIVANSRDVTETAVLQERLRRGERLEALGQLAGGVAHDFNNILAAILLYGQLLRDAFAPDDPRRLDAEEVVRAATRGAGVTRQLLAFSRQQALETEVLDLAAVVRDMGPMLRSLLPASVSLTLPPPDAPPVRVRAARAQLEQVVLNLAVNARDAMPEGGRLRFQVRAEDGEAKLLVRDTGHGIPASIRERIFDPFFTTKPVGKGTGLGLATVYGVVRQSGGAVSLDTVEGEGSTFVITLPLADAADEAPPAPEPARDAAPAPSRRVLVVEDEPALRRVLERVLAAEGHAVTVEEDGAGALARLTRGEPFDLVLTDAAMARVSGWQVAAEVARVRPGLPVVLMSGYADPGPAPAEASLPAPGVQDFLQKPFSNQGLLEVVRRNLPR